MSNVTSIAMPNYRGRKMTPGKLTYNPESQRLGVFIDYCPNCNSKIVANKDVVQAISRTIRHEQGKTTVRMLKALLKRLE